MDANSLLANSLLVHFAGNAVQFDIESEEIKKALAFHFRHSLTAEKSSIAEYEVRAESQRLFSAERDGETFFSGLNYRAALWQLTQDAITQLNGTASEELVFHAAALARQEDAVLLCGKSGSGKSSLSAWLAGEGLGYMTDEVISCPIGEQVIHGLSRAIVLKPGSAFIRERLLAEAPSEAVMRFSDDSAWIEPAALTTGGIKPTAAPRLLVFPRYLPEVGFQEKRITTADALFCLLQNLVNARNFSDHGFAETTRLARQMVAYEIIYSDIEKASAWIQKRLTTG